MLGLLACQSTDEKKQGNLVLFINNYLKFFWISVIILLLRWIFVAEIACWTFHTSWFFLGLQLSGHYVLSIFVMSMGYALAVAIQAVAACGNKNDSCGTNPDTQLALHIVILCVIVVGNFLGITSMVFHMRNRKILHPEWRNRKGCCC